MVRQGCLCIILLPTKYDVGFGECGTGLHGRGLDCSPFSQCLTNRLSSHPLRLTSPAVLMDPGTRPSSPILAPHSPLAGSRIPLVPPILDSYPSSDLSLIGDLNPPASLWPSACCCCVIMDLAYFDCIVVESVRSVCDHF